jgi:branched-chain amino acid aminotransferase
MTLRGSIHSYYYKNGDFFPVSAFTKEHISKGYSVYEVIRVIHGAFLFWEDHIDRLYKSVELSGFSYRLGYEVWRKLFNQLCKKNGVNTGNIKILLQQKANPSDTIFNLLVYFIPHAYPSEKEYKNGVSASLLQLVRVEPNIKKQHIRNFSKYARIKKERNVYEVLLVTKEGYITEGSRCNVFFIKGDKLITAPENQVLAGITRKYLLYLAKENNVSVEERSISKHELKDFDGAFISGTSPKVLALNRIDNQAYSVNQKLYIFMKEQFDNLLNSYIKNA